MKRITKNRFFKLMPEEIFASGESTDNAEGINISNTGKDIYWIAMKGKGKDWAVYYAWNSGLKFIKDFGEKVRNIDVVKNLFEVDDDVLALYRK